MSIALPSRFQIGDLVRVGNTTGRVSYVCFSDCEIFYEVTRGGASLGVFPSIEVSEPLMLVEA